MAIACEKVCFSLPTHCFPKFQNVHFMVDVCFPATHPVSLTPPRPFAPMAQLHPDLHLAWDDVGTVTRGRAKCRSKWRRCNSKPLRWLAAANLMLLEMRTIWGTIPWRCKQNALKSQMVQPDVVGSRITSCSGAKMCKDIRVVVALWLDFVSEPNKTESNSPMFRDMTALQVGQCPEEFGVITVIVIVIWNTCIKCCRFLLEWNRPICKVGTSHILLIYHTAMTGLWAKRKAKRQKLRNYNLIALLSLASA